MPIRRRMPSSGSVSANSIWSRSFDSALSIELQRSSRRSRASDAGGGDRQAETSRRAASSRSGWKSFSVSARRATVARSVTNGTPVSRDGGSRDQRRKIRGRRETSDGDGSSLACRTENCFEHLERGRGFGNEHWRCVASTDRALHPGIERGIRARLGGPVKPLVSPADPPPPLTAL